MSWFKVDDKLHSHKKAARAGVAAMGLWTVAGSWCADHLTDGFVPDYIAHRLAPGSADDLAMALVDAGLWTFDEEDGDKGWRFNDWDDYQPTRDEVEAKREQERDKKRRQRRDGGGRFKSSPDVSPGDTEGTPDGKDEGTPEGVTPSRPVPSRPDPTRPKVKSERRAPEKQLPDDWQPNDDHRTLAADQAVDVEHEAAKFRDHAAANDRRQRDWDAAFRTWLRRAADYGSKAARAGPRHVDAFVTTEEF